MLAFPPAICGKVSMQPGDGCVFPLEHCSVSHYSHYNAGSCCIIEIVWSSKQVDQINKYSWNDYLLDSRRVNSVNLYTEDLEGMSRFRFYFKDLPNFLGGGGEKYEKGVVITILVLHSTVFRRTSACMSCPVR